MYNNKIIRMYLNIQVFDSFSTSMITCHVLSMELRLMNSLEIFK